MSKNVGKKLLSEAKERQNTNDLIYHALPKDKERKDVAVYNREVPVKMDPVSKNVETTMQKMAFLKATQGDLGTVEFSNKDISAFDEIQKRAMKMDFMKWISQVYELQSSQSGRDHINKTIPWYPKMKEAAWASQKELLDEVQRIRMYGAQNERQYRLLYMLERGYVDQSLLEVANPRARTGKEKAALLGSRGGHPYGMNPHITPGMMDNYSFSAEKVGKFNLFAKSASNANRKLLSGLLGVANTDQDHPTYKTMIDNLKF